MLLKNSGGLKSNKENRISEESYKLVKKSIKLLILSSGSLWQPQLSQMIKIPPEVILP